MILTDLHEKTISKDAGKGLYKIKYPFMIKTLRLGIEGTLLGAPG